MTRLTFRTLCIFPLLCALLLPNVLPAQQHISTRAEFTRVVQQLQDKDSAVRTRAAMWLGNNYSFHQQARELLLTALHDIDPRVRAAVITALGKHHYLPAMPEFADVRAAVAGVLGIYHDQQAVDLLFGLLQDPEGKVRAGVAVSLASTCVPRALEPLRMLLDDKDVQVRSAAAASLGGLAQLPQWVDVPANWQRILNSNPSPNPQQRKDILRHLQEVGWDKTRAALSARLQDNDPSVRAQAALSLWKFNDPSVLTYLSKALHLPDDGIHHQLLQALCNSRDPKVLAAILALPMDRQDAEAMSSILQTLANFDDPRALAYVLKALKYPEASIHHQALSALTHSRDPKVLRCYLGAADG